MVSLELPAISSTPLMLRKRINFSQDSHNNMTHKLAY